MRDPYSSNRTFPQSGEPRRRLLNWYDYIQIINTGFFIVLGLVILIRLALSQITVMGVIVGAGFLLFGFYRLRAIWIFFRRRR
ncbi:MAG TPA: hypothetical protein VNM72_02765 [Blastocatellia bacterium]|nr:hypothetical protein [Blastocatellia bacterium]